MFSREPVNKEYSRAVTTTVNAIGAAAVACASWLVHDGRGHIGPSAPSEQKILNNLEVNKPSFPNYVWAGVVVLKSGSVLHATPTEKRSTEDLVVGESDSIISIRPRLYRTADGTQWINLISTKFAPIEQARDISRNYWFDVTTDRKQLTSYTFKGQNPSALWPVSSDDKGNLAFTLDHPPVANQGIATLSEMANDQLDQYYKDAGLEPTSATPSS